MTVDRYASARTMYESGMSVGDCATFYGITRQAMWKILLRRGTEMRPQQTRGERNHFHRGGSRSSKRAAHLVEMAVQKGVLVPEPCEVCGTTEDVRGHHDDYNAPLDVRWLCGRHHYEWHQSHTAVPLRAALPAKARSEIAAMGGKQSWANLSPSDRRAKIAKMLAARWTKVRTSP